MPTPKPNLTPDQIRGVQTVGRSVLLSAAAGSGKTRVLAERCAYLVCDAPPPHRCDVSELLVVTFTEAAAAEMRERIGRTLTDRTHGCDDNRLRAQAALLDQASIGTLHAFCANLLRQHFHLVGLDPAFEVMDEHEALLLRLDVGRDLIRRRYETDTEQRLSQLLDGYYDGEDERLLQEVIRLHAMMQSLVDPDAWVRKSLDRTAQAADAPLSRHPVGVALLDLIRRRITAMGGQCNHAIVMLKSLGQFPAYVDRVTEVLKIYRHLYQGLRTHGVDALSEILGDINQFDRLPPVPSSVPNKELAKSLVDDVLKQFKEGSWRKLLKFTEADWRDGMARVLPYAKELLSLVGDFDAAYRLAKDEARQVDFNDLERLTLRALRDAREPSLRPSPLARYYQRAFKHVLVDEFQDINEVQNAILSLVAGTGDNPEAPAAFFSVGDVKQSIYRFRLADPRQFLDRQLVLRNAGDAGEVIDLRQNFRSRGPLLEAINGVFARLMTRSATEIDYDQTQQLVPGRRFADPAVGPTFTGAPIELHVLPDDVEPGESVDPAVDDWDRTEREAALAAQRILQIVGRAGAPATQVHDRHGGPPRGARFGDIVVLLRTRKFKAGQILRIFDRFGIPCHADSGGGFFESTEIRDMLAILGLLDNQAQDIALAAFLRSPLAKLEHVEDAMASAVVAYRDNDPPIPFHLAIARYAAESSEPAAVAVRGRLAWLAELRHHANRRPVHETIQAIYQQSGYLAYVSGLPGGQQRSANLIELHDRAREFGRHRRQDLGRFLEFLRTLEAESDLSQAAVATEAQDVVRIMTVHGAKGLEFPVVVIPDLGKSINMKDAEGHIVFDRVHGLGMKVVNEELFARYTSAGHAVVADEVRNKLMAEELRVLYVAMTRAMEHLILIGTSDMKEFAAKWTDRWSGHTGPLPDADILGAKSMLGWLGPVWAAESAERRATLELFAPKLSDLNDPLGQATGRKTSPIAAPLQQRQPLPAAAPMTEEVERVIRRLRYEYPFEAQSAHRAVSSVTAEAKGASVVIATPDAPAPALLLPLPAFVAESPELAATDKGTATHLVLQHLRFTGCGDPDAIRRQVEQMCRDGRLTQEQCDAVDVSTIQWFVGTDLGRLLCENEPMLMREMPVYQSRPVDGLSSADPLDQLMLRGRIDLFAPLPGGGVLVDYKTDNVRTEAHIENRRQIYAPQMAAYADAIGRITGSAVAKRYLVFLTPRRIEQV